MPRRNKRSVCGYACLVIASRRRSNPCPSLNCRDAVPATSSNFFFAILLFLLSIRCTGLFSGEMSIDEINAVIAPHYRYISEPEYPYYFYSIPTRTATNISISNSIGDWVILETNRLVEKYTLVRINRYNVSWNNYWEVEVLERKPAPRTLPNTSEFKPFYIPDSKVKVPFQGAKVYAEPKYSLLYNSPYGTLPNSINILYPITFRLEERVICGKKLRFLAVDEIKLFEVITRYYSYDITTPRQQTELITRDHFGNETGRYQKIRDFYMRDINR